jgi:hypothetical protein
MRIKLLGGVVAAVCLVGMPAAYAQNDDSNKGADTTCTDFMAMDSADQAALIEQVQSATPDLKTNGAEPSDSNAGANASGGMSAESNTPSSDAGNSSSGDAGSSSADAAANASADSKAGATDDSNVNEVVAACQEDSSLSVGDALTR